MLSFFGEQCLKDSIVARVREHQRLDQIVQGTYWGQCDDGVWRGCSIGCAIHSGNHMDYEQQLGLPVALAYLNEHIFESLPRQDALGWPLRFIEAVPVGVDLDLVLPRFVHWILSDPHGIRRYANTDTLEVIDVLTDMYVRRIEGEPFDSMAARAVARAASAAARAVASAVASAASDATIYAARAAARAVASAVAIYAARAASAARDATIYAARAAIHVQADQLISILRSYESQPVMVYAPCTSREFDSEFIVK